jgi:4,5-DOPA dioxygenase extradiol
MNIPDVQRWAESLPDTDPMPVLFVGHGSPMNAIEDSEFSQGWQAAAQALPRPQAILCVSAHWETRGTYVTAIARPRTIHDFGGFPPELYAVQYPAPGSAWLAQAAHDLLNKAPAGFDQEWGLDHGCWSVLRRMFPAADVPIVQLSLDRTQPGPYHYALAQELAPLRSKGVLIVGSGNMVHNLRRIAFVSGDVSDFNRPYGLPWALEASALFHKLIDEGRHAELANYQALGSAVQLAVPTPEHYLPLLYVLALQAPGETATYFNDQPVGGSLTMTCVKIDR